MPHWQEPIKYTTHLCFHHSERGECQYFLREENEDKYITKSPWARLCPGKEPSGTVRRQISKYPKTQKSSHSNSQCFLVTEVSWRTGSLGNNQPDNIGSAHDERPAAEVTPSCDFISLCLDNTICSYCINWKRLPRNGQFGRTHTEKSTFLTPLEITVAAGTYFQSQN